MNKLTKRLAAIGAAMTMAVSMMSMGASAAEQTKGWAVHYYSYAPTNSNVYTSTAKFYYDGSNITKYRRICSAFTNNTNPDGSVPYVKYWGYVMKPDNTTAGTGFSPRYFYDKENNGTYYSLTVSVQDGQHLVVKHNLQNVHANISASGQTKVK